MSNAHKPGPWTVICHTAEDVDSITPACDWSIDGSNGKSVCFEGGYNDCASANARLIAAAPELLETALAVAVWWGKYLDSAAQSNRLENAEWDEFFRLRAAIAKATGASDE